MDVKNLPDSILKASADVNIYVRDITNKKPTVSADHGHYGCHCPSLAPLSSSDSITTISAFCFSGPVGQDSFQWSASAYIARMQGYIPENWKGLTGTYDGTVEDIHTLRPVLIMDYDQHILHRKDTAFSMSHYYRAWAVDQPILFSAFTAPPGFYFNPSPNFGSIYDANASMLIKMFAVSPLRVKNFVAWAKDDVGCDLSDLIEGKNMEKVRPSPKIKQPKKERFLIEPKTANDLFLAPITIDTNGAYPQDYDAYLGSFDPEEADEE